MTRGLRALVAGVGVGAFAAGVAVGTRPGEVAAERAAKREPDAGGRVAYVHLHRVLAETARGKQHAKALAAVRAKHAGRIDTLRGKLAEADRGVRVAANGDARYTLERQARDLHRELSEAEAEARHEFDAKSDRLVGEMYKELAVVAAQLARDHGLDAVQTYPVPPGTIDVQQMKGVLAAPSALLYVKRDADLTDEVIDRLDRRFEAEAGGE